MCGKSERGRETPRVSRRLLFEGAMCSLPQTPLTVHRFYFADERGFYSVNIRFNMSCARKRPLGYPPIITAGKGNQVKKHCFKSGYSDFAKKLYTKCKKRLQSVQIKYIIIV